MKCEYCDSIIREVPDNGVCPNCGESILCWKPLSEAPTLKIKVRTGYLKLNKQSVRLYAKLPRMPQKDMEIAYSEIFDVSFVPATKWLIGFLCIRRWKERHIPLPRTFWEKKLTDSMIWFENKDNVAMFRAYEFLKQHAELNRKKKIT